MQRAVLYQNGCDRAAALVELGLDDRTLGLTVGVCLEVRDFGGQQDHFEQVFNALAILCRDVADDGVAAPLLGHELILGQLLEHALGVCARLIDLIDRDNDRHLGRLGVVDGLDGLGHDAVVGCHNQDGDIGDLRAAGTHGCEGRMAGGVQEGDLLVADLHAVCADVLGDAAGLALGDLGLADGVEQGGLAVVNVAHDDHDRVTRLELLFLVFVLVEQALLDGYMDFLLDLGAHLLGHNGRGVEVNGLGDRGHDAKLHEFLDDIGRRALHALGELADVDLVRDGDLELDLLGRGLLVLALQAAHFLLLLLAALARSLLLGALVGLFGQLLLLLAGRGHALGLLRDQRVDALVVFIQVDIAARAGVDAVHLLDAAVLLRLLGLLPCCALLLLLVGGLLLLGRGLLARGGQLLAARLLLALQYSLQVRDRMALGQNFKNQAQVMVVQDLHVVLGRLPMLCQNIGNLLIAHAKVLRDFVDTVFIL